MKHAAIARSKTMGNNSHVRSMVTEKQNKTKFTQFCCKIWTESAEFASILACFLHVTTLQIFRISNLSHLDNFSLHCEHTISKQPISILDCLIKMWCWIPLSSFMTTSYYGTSTGSLASYLLDCTFSRSVCQPLEYRYAGFHYGRVGNSRGSFQLFDGPACSVQIR